MVYQFAPTVRKALSLERDGVFRLLVVMTALLGWVVALGTGGALVMHGLYSDWQLERERTLMVYLMPDSDPVEVQQLVGELQRVPGVTGVVTVPQAELGALLEPYTGTAGGVAVPLPQVLRLDLGGGFDRTLLDPVVVARFPTAEIDDARPVMVAVTKGVRLVQVVGIGLAVMMALVMGLLVTLTVRAGLRAQRSTLELLQQLGATHRLIMGLVAGQVLQRVLLGWALAGAGAVAVMLVGVLVWPVLDPYLTVWVWLGLAVSPALLPLVAWVTARMVVSGLLRRPQGAGAV